MFEEVGVFYRGLVLGIMIAAPVGPIGLLCIRRTIQKGLLIGFMTGLGAACADTLFGGIAAFGVSSILSLMKEYDPYIRLIGGIFMLATAFHTWHDKPHTPKKSPREIIKRMVGHVPEKPLGGSLRAFSSSFAITLTNPVTLVAILAVVATFGNMQSQLDAYTITGGIFTGSALWWITLSGGMALLRDHFNENRVIILNRVTAVLLAALGLWALLSGIHRFLA